MAMHICKACGKGQILPFYYKDKPPKYKCVRCQVIYRVKDGASRQRPQFVISGKEQ